MRTLHIGAFNAEKYWLPEEHAMLPQLLNNKKNSLVTCMDELLFVFAKKGDILCTLQSFDPDLYEYLSSIGYEFLNINFAGIGEYEIQERLFKSKVQMAKEMDIRMCQPYAINHYTDKIMKKYSLINKLPSVDATITVNSKIYSARLANQIACNPYESIVVNNIEDLQYWGKKTLEGNKRIVIKTPYGVSGNGNMMIDNNQIFERVVRHFVKEYSKGKIPNLVIEPYVNKKRDFSAHYYLNEVGELEFRSIQLMNNKGFCYLGSYQSTRSDIELLNKKGFFECCEKIMKSIFLSGYWGPICVDSMELESGDIVPLVEINARKSMGLINVRLQKQIAELGSNLKSFLMFFNIQVCNYIKC